MYELRLYHDHFSAGAKTAKHLRAQHGIAYVASGAAALDEQPLEKDTAEYWADSTSVASGAEGAWIWRWELVPATDPENLAHGEGIESHIRMARRIRMFQLVPTSKWLFRLDSIIENRGSTGLHSHPGSGIRCMIDGQIRIESDKGESSENSRPGDAWYEEGSYPLVSTSDPGNYATFLRGMVLPPEYARYPDTAVWIEGHKGCTSDWKSYVQRVVTLI